MNQTFFSKCSGLVGAALLLLSGCAQSEPTVTPEPRQVLLATVASVGEAAQASYPGRTRASETSNMAFRVSGTLASIPVREGSFVRRGQTLARLDDRDYQTQLSATEAEYARVKAEAERVIALYEDSATSQNNYDQARFGLQQITQKLQNHRDQVADCVLTAPFDGYVQTLLHEAYETVGAGMPVLTMFSASGVEVVINIPASEYMKQSEFGAFTASFDALPNKTFALRPVSIARRANANQLYEVRLALEDANRQITPGMATMVHLTYRPNEATAVVVPASALFCDDQGSAVFVYADGKVHRTAVTPGFIHSNGTIELEAGSVKAGDRVVCSGVHSLTDGENVRPYPTPSATNIGGLL